MLFALHCAFNFGLSKCSIPSNKLFAVLHTFVHSQLAAALCASPYLAVTRGCNYCLYHLELEVLPQLKLL